MLRRSLQPALHWHSSSSRGLSVPQWVATAPLQGSLEGRHVSRTPLNPPVVYDVFEVTGDATHLGEYELVIEVVVNFGTLPPTAAGTLTFTAANGDTLVAGFTGSSSLVVPGLVLITELATIDPDRSTGRFAGTGSSP
jgi:hypothetical protein